MANGSRLDGSEWHAGIPSWHSKPKSGEDTEMDSDTYWFKADPNKAWRRTGPRGRRPLRPPPYLTCLWRKGRIYEIFPHDANIAAQLSRIVYLKQVHHLGCPSARKCGILCFSA